MKYSKWKRITLLKIVCSKWCKGLRILIYDNKEACKVGGDECTNICYGQNENSMSSPERWENLYRIFVSMEILQNFACLIISIWRFAYCYRNLIFKVVAEPFWLRILHQKVCTKKMKTVCRPQKGERICTGFLRLVYTMYLCCCWISSYQEKRVGIPDT
jgi:hypothetical protein